MNKNIFKNGVKREYMDKKTILKYVTESDIFELVFKFKPKEFDYVTSPFRPDKNPDCWFHYSPTKGELRFNDFGDNREIRGIKMRNLGCFDAVMVYYNLSFYDTIKFVIDKLIYGEEIEMKDSLDTPLKPKIKDTEIFVEARRFLISDKNFWFDRYGISKKNLIEDRVFPVSKYHIKSHKGNFSSLVRTNTYCFADFNDNKKKLYRPFNKSSSRFITNCTQDDIGGLNHLPESYDKLVITKSYKDYRVLKNQGLNVIWFQNEGMYPSMELLLPICYKAQDVIIFFDNDNAGIKASDKLKGIINSFIENKSRNVYLPVKLYKESITDPSDFIERYGRDSLIKFLSNNAIL